MTSNELYLKTVFSCIACDGEIAPEEIELVRKLSKENDAFKDIDAETSDEIYNPSTNNHTIILRLKKPQRLICDKCDSLKKI